MPESISPESDAIIDILKQQFPILGLTRRDLFAGLAMAGFCSNPEEIGANDLADYVVKQADALINRLDNTKPVEMWGLWSMSGDKPHWLPAMDCCPNVLAYFSEADAIKGMEHQLSLWDDDGEPMRLIPRKFSDGDGPVADTDSQPQ